ncbi:inositol phosphate phosphatase SopB [Sansalvadorimonas verongulae]|uniref:inositol phosphate phosphatase SopB n=1 Tax=Sansalvadorimonas verongulae TaxID=2172824 RepID=UPI0012BC8539|nr:inositol phosphate phosphatase SopB [Sansalvadorimonas verongulae]MTI15550.1 hypothetical protein [Sansalvadorimonas verongulae]
MQPLKQALESGKANTYEQSDLIASKPVKSPSQRWLVKVFGPKDSGPVYTRRSVEDNLSSDYGESVSKKVMRQVGNKPLTAHRIVKLHNKAVKLRHAIDKHNSQHAHTWMNLDKKDSLASQLFTRTHGYSPQNLLEYERNRLQQHLEAVFYHKGEHELSRLEASQLVADTLAIHNTALSGAAPETARVLGYAHDSGGHGKGAFYPQAIEQWFESVSLNDSDRRLVRAFQYNSSHTARINSRSPFKLLKTQPWEDQISSTRTHTGRLQASLKALQRGALTAVPEAVRQAMVRDINHQINQSRQHIFYLEGLEKADFRGAEQQRKAEEHMLDTAILVVQDNIDKVSKKGNFEKVGQLGQFMAQLKGRKERLAGKSFPPVMSMKKLVKGNTSALQKEMLDAGIQQRDLKKVWSRASAAVANTAKWEIIEKTVPLRADGVLHQYTSRLVPAGQMRFTPSGHVEGNRDPFPSSYAGRGRSSADPNERIHAINLYENEVLSSDGKTLYKGLRSGTLFSHTTKDMAKQQSILENRAMEVLRAAFVQKLSDLLPAKQQEVLDGAPLPLDLISTSLLSPDQIRHVTGIHDDELTFQEAQNKILQQLCSEPVTMDILDSNGHSHTVTADIRLTTLNIPVNNMGLNPVLSGVGQTWGKADGYNQIGFENLFGNTHPDTDIGGAVGEWLRGPGQSSPDKDKVLQLVQQIRTLYSRGLHHLEGRDAYKLVERVQLLAFKMGAASHFNCKSGKDRTGEADARIKAFATEVDRYGYVPDPEAPATQEHLEAIQAFIYGAGNLEIQQQNIGVPHFKTGTGKDELGEEFYELVH